jgi:hypothetical protein
MQATSIAAGAIVSTLVQHRRAKSFRLAPTT